MSGPIPGYPTPAQVPDGLHEVRDDPDAENPNELVLDATQVNAALPPRVPRAAAPDAAADLEDQA